MSRLNLATASRLLRHNERFRGQDPDEDEEIETSEEDSEETESEKKKKKKKKGDEDMGDDGTPSPSEPDDELPDEPTGSAAHWAQRIIAAGAKARAEKPDPSLAHVLPSSQVPPKPVIRPPFKGNEAQRDIALRICNAARRARQEPLLRRLP